MGHYSYPLNENRERMLDQLEGATDANTRADAIDSAIRHYLQSVENYQEAADHLTPAQARLISTDEVSLTYYPKVR